jgi:uncharacterized protein (TIGR03435 family)
MSRLVWLAALAASTAGLCSARIMHAQTAPSAQSPLAPSAEYEVISIKRNTDGPGTGGLAIRPDGTFIMTNGTIKAILLAGSPVPTREVTGFPDWVNTEAYDITAKAPAGSTRAQSGEMMRNMLIERMKLRGHVEERERNTYALVLARGDGRLGPQFKPSTLDCAAPTAPASPEQPQVAPAAPQNRACRRDRSTAD